MQNIFLATEHTAALWGLLGAATFLACITMWLERHLIERLMGAALHMFGFSVLVWYTPARGEPAFLADISRLDLAAWVSAAYFGTMAVWTAAEIASCALARRREAH